MLKVGSLFSGIGGLDLAFEMANCQIVYQVEKDKYCQQVLRKHWSTLLFEDVKDVGKHNLPQADIICGGVPCQPASSAGKRKGEEDKNWLWDEAIRIVRECKPAGFLFENVSGLRTLAKGQTFGKLLKHLAKGGYVVEWLHLEAAHVGASHHRERIWILGYSASYRHTLSRQAKSEGAPEYDRLGEHKALRSSFLVSSSSISGRSRGERHESLHQPSLGRTNDGISLRMDFPSRIGEPQKDWEEPRIAPKGAHFAHRMRMLGNAVVPQQAYPVVKTLVDFLERALQEELQEKAQK